MGTDEGPHRYEDYAVARIAAQAIDVMLNQEPGRCRAVEYVGGPKRLRDEKKTVMGATEAIAKMENGLV
jgi:hypothetical protein